MLKALFSNLVRQQRETSRAPSRSDSLSSSHTRHNAPSPTPPPNLNAQRRAPTPNLNGSNPSQQPRSPIDHNPPPLSNLNQTAANNNTGAPTSNDVVVPNKSKMIVEEPSGNFTTQTQLQSPTALSPTSQQPLDHSGQRSSPTDSSRRDELSPLQNQQPNFSTPGSTGGPFRGQHQSRVSEVSSVGTHSKFFGGYAGSATGPPSESGGRRSVSFSRTFSLCIFALANPRSLRTSYHRGITRTDKHSRSRRASTSTN